jgi:hypothetical protein
MQQKSSSPESLQSHLTGMTKRNITFAYSVSDRTATRRANVNQMDFPP